MCRRGNTTRSILVGGTHPYGLVHPHNRDNPYSFKPIELKTRVVLIPEFLSDDLLNG